MLKIAVDTGDLIKAVNKMGHLPDELNKAQVAALNDYGNGLANQVIHTISEQTGFPETAASRFVTRLPATMALKVFEIRVRQALLEKAVTEEGPTRDFLQRDKKVYEGSTLVTVVTAQDDTVCPICEQIAAEGPYTVEEVEQLKLRHPHFLNRDLRCRCATAPFNPKQRLDVEMKFGAGQASLDLSLTLHQLAARVAEETRTKIRLK